VRSTRQHLKDLTHAHIMFYLSFVTHSNYVRLMAVFEASRGPHVQTTTWGWWRFSRLAVVHMCRQLQRHFLLY